MKNSQNELKIQKQIQNIKNQSFLSSSLDFNYKMLVKACKFTTLYLIKKISDLDYLFEDPLQRQYRVKINEKISCSCHQGNLGHCIHSLYVLMRILKIEQTNQLLFKSTYSQKDLKYIIDKEHQFSKIKNKNQQKALKAVQQQNKAKDEASSVSNCCLLIKNKHNQDQSIKIKQQQQQQQLVFNSDDVCPICYDHIDNNSAIIDCWECRNYFHTKCLRVWISTQNKKIKENEIQSDAQVGSCPMCRHSFQSLVNLRIQRCQKKFIQHHQSFGVVCFACGKQILINLYKCLLCQKVELCRDCYTKWEHRNHDKFICKLGKRSQWTVSERSQFNINKLNANLEYFKKYSFTSLTQDKQGDEQAKQKQLKDLMGENYNKFIQSYIKKPTVLQHIMKSLMDVQKQVHKTYKKLEFTQSDIVCCVCRKKKIVGMRRMACNHFIDEKCLKFILQNGMRQCPIDKKYILPGMNNLSIKLQ